MYRCFGGQALTTARRARTSFSEDDYRLNRDFLAGYTTAAGVEVWAWG